MKFFIDTANLAQIKEANDLGILDGVTTNPSLMAKEGIKGTEATAAHYKTICEMVDGPVSAEVLSTTFDEMIAEDVARAFTGSDVGAGGGLISGILRPATKGLSNVTGRTEQIADILAKAELDPAYAAMLMKKYNCLAPFHFQGFAQTYLR